MFKACERRMIKTGPVGPWNMACKFCSTATGVAFHFDGITVVVETRLFRQENTLLSSSSFLSFVYCTELFVFKHADSLFEKFGLVVVEQIRRLV